jgi:transposase
MKETLKHKQAFDYYYACGEKRRQKEVAEKFGVSDTTVYKWSKAFNWKKRIQTRDNRIAQRMERMTDTQILHEKLQYRKIVRAVIQKCLIKNPDGTMDVKIEPESIADLEKAIKLDLLLIGEPTERQEIISNKERIERLKILFQKYELGKDVSESGEMGEDSPDHVR